MFITGQLPEDPLLADAPVLPPEPAGRKPKKRPASAEPGPAAAAEPEPAAAAAGPEAKKRPAAAAGPEAKKTHSCGEARRLYSKAYHKTRAQLTKDSELSPDQIKKEAAAAGKAAVQAWLES